ncbi:MAG TPA: DUF1700 domain-containing protein [Phenylobacterium sp.]|uniref:DUF1700 domain-containing protein n=1 Tax=Phenylobacterium sp. TaxID=1871053 RepID=UPI002B45D691|nr:DUF1700 domain-containing protein [Phenylobacterium sp.]HKR90150.1 DUF1700 domain-containing protein [Phenylobacterium sp.]
MTREAFIERLREGLRGLPPQTVADIVADYETHFADGEAAGRNEAEVAAALGDPGRLARELRAEIGLKRWEEERSPSGAAAAVFAVLGLGALDLFILLPVLMTVGGVLFGLSMASVAGLVGGGAMLAMGPFTDFPGGPAAAILGGLGVMSGAAALGALIALVTIGIVNALVWYGRLHYRLLRPALDTPSQGAAA